MNELQIILSVTASLLVKFNFLFFIGSVISGKLKTYGERRDTYAAIAVLLKDLRWHRRGVVDTPHPSTKFTLVFLVDCDVALHKRDAFYLKNLQQIYLLPPNL